MADLNVDVVFLDAGGVLVGPSRDVIRDRFAAAGFSIDPDLLFEAHYRGVQAIDIAEAAPEVFDDYHRAYAAHIGVDEVSAPSASAVLQGLWELSGLWGEILPWAADGLAAIAATGVPIVIVSNADGTVEELLTGTGLLQVGPGPGTEVAAVVDSGALGIAKPDPAIFHHALGLVGATPDRAIHVGDAYQYDVRGARAAGVRPVLLDPLGIRTEADCDRVASLVEVVALLH
ncbi:MAG TPA: HAD-IA family hydrolase [Acidimicrobiales bacterium]|nr:HAD-IA family hydrolase [Acidimicrobiales bacterium]